MPYRVAIESPAAPDALATVDAGIGEYSAPGAPFSNVRPLHVIATSDAGMVVGGAIGRTWGECCELQQLWVLAERRGNGTGTEILARFEREASGRGCRLAYLDTFSFQAPAFYTARGYVEVLRTVGFSGGVTKLTMQKELPASGTEA